MNERIYLLLNDEDSPVARGLLITPPDGEELRVKVLDEDIDEIEDIAPHKLVTLVGMLQTMPTLRGEVIGASRDVLKLRTVESKEDVRDMLRVKVAFDSLIYPVDVKWTGRRKVEFVDLSCGGIAFYCDEEMQRGELVEIVIPVTPQPLVMRCRILRAWEKEGRSCYAARFINMCHDEEKLICEAVFNIQLNQHTKKTEREGVVQ